MTYYVKLILAFVILDVLIDLFKAAGKGTPAFRYWAMPYQDVPLVGSRCDHRLSWVPLVPK